MWKDLGNSATTGTIASGTVASQVAPLVSVFGPFTLASTNLSNPLPVTLTDFNCGLNDDGIVEIRWSTASELNNDYFEIERSIDGEIFQSTSKRINGAGTTNAIHNYMWNDVSAPAGVLYYRLKQVDFDGTTSYNEVCAVNNSTADFEVRAYPNPSTTGQFMIDLHSRKVGTLSIYDAMEKELRVPVKIDEQKITINSSGLADGIYIIKLFLDQKLTILKVVVKK